MTRFGLDLLEFEECISLEELREGFLEISLAVGKPQFSRPQMKLSTYLNRGADYTSLLLH